MELFGLLIVIVVYLCLVYPASLAKKNAKGKRTVNFRKAAEPQTAPEAPKSAEESAMVFETAAPSVMERAYQPVRKPFAEDDTLYQGSLNAVTGEGTDPCHEDQLADIIPAETEPAAAGHSGGLGLSWTGNEVVRGIVMSEVLKRRH